MKKTIWSIVFLFLMVSSLLGQNSIRIYKKLVKNGTATIDSVAFFAYQDSMDTTWSGNSDKYFIALEKIDEIVDSINTKIKDKKLKWQVDQQGTGYFVQELKRKEISGNFICLKQTPYSMVFYAEGIYRPRSVLLQGLINVLSWKKSIIKGRAYFFINFSDNEKGVQNNIKFYLDTNNWTGNFYIKKLAKNNAKHIFETTAMVFRIVAQE